LFYVYSTNKRFSVSEFTRSVRGRGLYRHLIRVDELKGATTLYYVRLLVRRIRSEVSRGIETGATQPVNPNSIAVGRLDM